MYKINLSEEEKRELEIVHRHTKDADKRDRIKAVLLRTEGWSLPKIAQALRISEATVTNFVRDYCNHNKLKSESGGSEGYLNKEQTREIISHLEQKTYLKVCEIREFIFLKYNIKYSIRGLTNWLHANKFVYKKPVGIPRKSDLNSQKEFIEYYNNLKNNLKSDEVILFMDAVHPTQNTKFACGWIKKGVDKPMPTTASRTRLNYVGAVDIHNPSKVISHKFDTVNQEAIISSLEIIRNCYSDKGSLNIIADGAGYNKAIEVKKKATELNIKLHYLPPYSPNLNPIERLWKLMNEKARNNQFFATKSCFLNAIDTFFYETVPKITQELSTRITDNFQIFPDTKQKV